MKQRTRLWALLFTVCLLFFGCGSGKPPPRESVDLVKKTNAPSSEPQREPAEAYEAPTMAMASFHPDKAEGPAQTRIDLSAVSEGYVAVSAISERRLKFQVCKDDTTYNYDIASDGKPAIFPLQCGDGDYIFRVMENVSEKKYAQIYRAECNVKLLDEFQPFLRPSNYTSYDAQSECVRGAAHMAAKCSSKLEVVSAVYEFICSSVRYDYEKAASVKAGYLPDVDETMLSGKGICFDYASLAAAMLRSQGVPTKIVFGYVAPNDLYHAWNMFYTEESGWVTVSFEVSDKSWNRIDLTFSAGGVDDQFIGDGTNYTDVYFY